MLLQIADVLPEHTLTSIQELSDRDDLFVDGQATAGWKARERKHNLQGGQSKLVSGVLQKAEEAVMDNQLVQAAARPRNMVQILLSRYDSGMTYGNHVDDALMRGQRTDVSFTLFLTPPDAYTGGELVIDEPGGEQRFKLDAGSMVLYPSTTLHRVEPVSEGRRVVIVGWLRSFVRDAVKREILFDLDRSAHALRGSEGQAATALDLTLKTRSNLLRLWAED